MYSLLARLAHAPSKEVQDISQSSLQEFLQEDLGLPGDLEVQVLSLNPLGVDAELIDANGLIIFVDNGGGLYTEHSDEWQVVIEDLTRLTELDWDDE